MKDAPFVQPGYVLENKYRVEHVIGTGGMGVVVAARHITLDELVAIKFMIPNGKEESSSRFLREARAAIKLKSEHVTRVMDVGTLPTGELYIVMEYLKGYDLSALAVRGMPVVEEAVEYVLQACEALAEAHALGIVHRDLKPANLFLTKRPNGSPCIKVLDFGISKMGSLTDVTITSNAVALGTPLYMSPEQIRSPHEVDARADIWSMGIVLYQLLAGDVPFDVATIPKLFYYVIERPHFSLREKVPHVPVKLEAIIDKCLEKDPKKRYQNVAALADALLEFLPKSRRFDRSSIGPFTPILPSLVQPTLRTISRVRDFIPPPKMNPSIPAKSQIKNGYLFLLVGVATAGITIAGQALTKTRQPLVLSSQTHIDISSLPDVKEERPAQTPVVPVSVETPSVKPKARPKTGATILVPVATAAAPSPPPSDDREVIRK